MDDPRELEDRILRGMAPARKLEVMQGLIREAYRLKAAWIRSLHPELGEEEVRDRVRQVMGGGGS